MAINNSAHKLEIKNNFSRHASLYDKYADVQNLAANELIKRTPPSGSIEDILDIGCGTGSYTLELRNKFKNASITALDISEEMISMAKRKLGHAAAEFIVGDAESANLSGRHDLITSNATFQWFDDLALALERYSKALKPEGSIIFSMFGPLTFRELGGAIKEVFGPAAQISSGRFPARDVVAASMIRYFSRSAAEEVVVKRRYASLTELLKRIKYTGTRGVGLARAHQWSRNVLNRVEEAYISTTGSIEASYQIFYCKASR